MSDEAKPHPEPRRYTCGACGKQGHSTQTCPSLRKRGAKLPEGELAALVFEALDLDPPWTLAEIVKALRVTPDYVRRMKAEHDAGWSEPKLGTVLTRRDRVKLESLARKEVIERVRLEGAEVRERSKLDRTGMREETERAKAHARSLEAIAGGKR